MRLFVTIVAAALLSVLLLGCDSAQGCSYHQIDREFAALQGKMNLSEDLTEQEICQRYAGLFEKISEGQRRYQRELADLVRKITNKSIEFTDDEVFVLAADLATVFSEMAQGNADFGIQNIAVKHSDADTIVLQINYIDVPRFSVRVLDESDEWYSPEFLVPYDGSLGKYCVQIIFHDTAICAKFTEKYSLNEIHDLAGVSSVFGHSVKIRAVSTPDHGFVIYVGSDAPIHAATQESVPLNFPTGSVCITLAKQSQ